MNDKGKYPNLWRIDKTKRAIPSGKNKREKTGENCELLYYRERQLWNGFSHEILCCLFQHFSDRSSLNLWNGSGDSSQRRTERKRPVYYSLANQQSKSQWSLQCVLVAMYNCSDCFANMECNSRDYCCLQTKVAHEKKNQPKVMDKWVMNLRVAKKWEVKLCVFSI